MGRCIYIPTTASLIEGSLIPQGQRPCVCGSQPFERFWVPGFLDYQYLSLLLLPHPHSSFLRFTSAFVGFIDFLALPSSLFPFLSIQVVRRGREREREQQEWIGEEGRFVEGNQSSNRYREQLVSPNREERRRRRRSRDRDPHRWGHWVYRTINDDTETSFSNCKRNYEKFIRAVIDMHDSTPTRIYLSLSPRRSSLFLLFTQVSRGGDTNIREPLARIRTFRKALRFESEW